MANHRLWAPWRLKYIESDKTSECIFCTKPELSDDEALIVHRGETCVVMLNLYPYTNGHVMIAPYQHTPRLQDLPADTAQELIALTQRSLRALDQAYGPQGYNLGANLGAVAGAGVEDHVHMHVVPRWKGDTNFMPVVGDTKVMPEELGDTLVKVRTAFAAQED